MAADDKGLLDKLILQARLADEENDPTPDDPGQDDPDEPEDPPYDPGHPQPGDPDDPGEDDPEEPEEPEPDKEKCKRLKVELANAEQAAKEAGERMREAAEEFNQKSREVEARWQEFKRQTVAFGVGNFDAFKKLKKGSKPKSFTLPSEVWDAWQAYQVDLAT